MAQLGPASCRATTEQIDRRPDSSSATQQTCCCCRHGCRWTDTIQATVSSWRGILDIILMNSSDGYRTQVSCVVVLSTMSTFWGQVIVKQMASKPERGFWLPSAAAAQACCDTPCQYFSLTCYLDKPDQAAAAKPCEQMPCLHVQSLQQPKFKMA